MMLKLAISLLGMFLVAAEPTAPQSREVARSDDLKVTMSKPSGDTEIEVIQMDLGDYRLLYYIQPVWDAGSVQGKNGRRVPVKMEVAFVLRFDKRTGEIEVLDGQLASAAASGDVDCASNGCDGVCCAIQTDTAFCIVCTCCDQGKDNCHTSLVFCRKTDTE